MSTDKYDSISKDGQVDRELAWMGEAAIQHETAGLRGYSEAVPGWTASGLRRADAIRNKDFSDEYLQGLREAGSEIFGLPEDICGNDDRTKVGDTTAPPWCKVCKIYKVAGNGDQYIASGWFAGPRTVITSGHVVFSKESGGWAQAVEVIPGMSGSYRPFGSDGRPAEIRSVRGWTEDQDANYDIGCIILPDNTLGRQVGSFGFGAYSDNTLRGSLVNTAGYPADIDHGMTMEFTSGAVGDLTDHMLSYLLDSYGGQSGSPVWRYVDSGRYVVGVHGYGGCPNKAVRIDSAWFSRIQSWVNV